MSLSFCSLASGSSGNCYLIKTENTSLLVDAGISGKKIFQGLEDREIDPRGIDGLLITHEHIDHVKSVKVLLNKIEGLKVFANDPTWECIGEKLDSQKHVVFDTGSAFEIGDIRVTTFALSHDAVEPVGYSFSSGGKSVSIVTDTGYITEEIYLGICNSDLLVLEANHDIETLKFSRYPYPVKRRILGDKGHLSNDTAGEVLCKILNERSERTKRTQDQGTKTQRATQSIPRVLLAHLSKETNFPEMALTTVRNKLEEAGLYIGKDLDVEIITRDTVSQLYTV